MPLQTQKDALFSIHLCVHVDLGRFESLQHSDDVKLFIETFFAVLVKLFPSIGC